MVRSRGPTKALVEVLEGSSRRLEKPYQDFTELASLNKIRLEFFRVLGIEEPLRDSDEKRLARIVRTVETISKMFRSLDYAFYKLLRPVTYVPADIDILVAARHISEAVSRLRSLGFEIEVCEPYCMTLAKSDVVVDLYTNPSLGSMVYLDGSKLLEHVEEAEFHQVLILSLERSVEVLVSAAHAIYKEKLYTLNDYFTVKRWTTVKTLRIADELKARETIEISSRINKSFTEGLLEAPHRVRLPTWVSIWAKKIMEDPGTRASAPNVFKAVLNRRGGLLVKAKLFRRTY